GTEEHRATGELEARECIAAGGGKEEGRDRDRAGDDRAVQRVAPEVEGVEGLVVAGGRPVPRKKREACKRVGERPEGGRHTPEERDREQRCDEEHAEVCDRGAHAVSALAAGDPGGGVGGA